MPDLRIEIVGDDELSDKLRDAADKVENLRPIMEDIGDYLTGFFGGEVFASRGGVFGHPWPALNSAYAVLKAKEWPGAPPLVQTGQMQRSFESQATSDYVRITNSDPKFERHQLGQGVPQRVMMDLDRPRLTNIVALVDRQLMRSIGAG